MNSEVNLINKKIRIIGNWGKRSSHVTPMEWWCEEMHTQQDIESLKRELKDTDLKYE